MVNNTIDRISNINWEKIGDNHKDLSLLGYEYLRRLAYFFNENNLKPINPMFASVVACITKNYYLSTSKENFKKYCNQLVKNTLKYSHNKNIIEYYFQVEFYPEDISIKKRYIDIYEPLIRIWELNGDFQISNLGIEIKHSGYFPTKNFYNNFKNKPQKDISMFY